MVLVLDWCTKKIVGHYAGVQCKAEHWLDALEHGLNKQFPQGVLGEKLNLMSDNGCQPTATRFMRTCSDLCINQAFTSYNNPKGNADTERMMRTLKEEFAWVNEWRSPSEFIQALSNWIEYYNNEYFHSSLEYRTPVDFEKQKLGEILLTAA